MGKIILPLMMYGKNGFEWHRKDMPVMHRPIIGAEPIKSGKKKGQLRKVRAKEWEVKTRTRKTVVGYDHKNPYTRGKNKGKPREIIEDREFPVMSTGWFPTVNHIYMQIGGGASRRLKPIAEQKLVEWRGIAMEWAVDHAWYSLDKPTQVILGLDYYLPSDCTGDTHNTKKLLLDALEGVIHNNDFYMLDQTLSLSFDDENPRIEISKIFVVGRR
jgi:hypothetical protein